MLSKCVTAIAATNLPRSKSCLPKNLVNIWWLFINNSKIRAIISLKQENFKMTKIFYIHGFGSTIDSPTLKMLQKTYPDAIGLTYDHTNPKESISKLARQVNEYSIGEHVVIIGSSLGGWYVEQLTDRVVADFILYNPATMPWITLDKYDVGQEVLYKYKEYSTVYRPYTPVASRTVILSTDDEVIDPKYAMVKYMNLANSMLTSGGHRMTQENMDLITDEIKFLENQLHD
jgi:predicted esterase YcpF (UPF0227 family)